MTSKKRPKNRGEGDKVAARRYNEETTEFARSRAGRKAMRHREELTPDEEQELSDAEREGTSRVKEKDPQVSRNYKRPVR